MAADIIPRGRYTILVGSSSEKLPPSGEIVQPETTLTAPDIPAWYFAPKGAPGHGDFEALVGHFVAERLLKKG